MSKHQFTLLTMVAFGLMSMPVLAQDSAEGAQLTLKSAATKSEAIIDGALWKCQDTTCKAASVSEMPTLRSCQVVVRQLGAVSQFTYRGISLTEAQLAQCNTKAKA